MVANKGKNMKASWKVYGNLKMIMGCGYIYVYFDENSCL